MRDVAILASGPSMTPAVVDLVRRLGCFSIVINNTFRLMPDADALFASDAAWWQVHPDALDFRGACFISEDQRVKRATFVRPEGNHAGCNSALRAAEFVAHWSDCKRILLFGVDLRDDELTHWHGQHERGLFNSDVRTFGRARARWAEFAARTDRPEVLNCNPRSALKCFPIIDPESLLPAQREQEAA